MRRSASVAALLVITLLVGAPQAPASSPTWQFENPLGGLMGAENGAVVYGGALHLFTYDARTGCLVHAWWNGNWQSERLDGPRSTLPGHLATETGHSPRALRLGSQLHVFSTSQVIGITTLRHAWWNGSSWSFETLDGAGSRYGATGATTHPVGLNLSATVFNGAPHLLYPDRSTHNLRHAWWTGATWRFEVLDGRGSRYPGHQAIDAGFTSGATPYAGELHAFYTDATNLGLRHAWWTGSTWRFETLDGSGSHYVGAISGAGYNPALLLVGTQLHVFFGAANGGAIRHAWLTGSTWQLESIDGPLSTVPNHTSAAVESPAPVVAAGQLHVFLYEALHRQLRHAWNTASGWHLEVLDGAGSAYGSTTNGNGNSAVALSYLRQPHVLYGRRGDGGVRHAWVE